MNNCLYISDRACKRGDLELLKEQWKVLSNRVLIIKSSGINLACTFGHLPIVQFLVKEGIDINFPDAFGQTPFYFACANGHIELVMYLLERENIDINRSSYNGKTLFYIACERDQVEVIKYLIKIPSVNKHTASIYGTTPFEEAIMCGSSEVIKYFMEVGWFDPNIQKYAKAAFRIACLNGYLEIAKYLVEIVGLVISNEIIFPDTDDTLFYKALRGRKFEIFEYLLDTGHIHINIRNKKGMTILHQTCNYLPDCTIISEMLIRRGAAINIKDANGRTSLSYCKSNIYNVLTSLVYTLWCSTPLHRAIYENDIFMLHRLLDTPDVNIMYANYLGWTSLHIAILLYRPDMLKILFENLDKLDKLDKNVIILMSTNDKFTILHLASSLNYPDIFLMIIDWLKK